MLDGFLSTICALCFHLKELNHYYVFHLCRQTLSRLKVSALAPFLHCWQRLLVVLSRKHFHTTFSTNSDETATKINFVHSQIGHIFHLMRLIGSQTVNINGEVICTMTNIFFLFFQRFNSFLSSSRLMIHKKYSRHLTPASDTWKILSTATLLETLFN